MDKGNTNPLAVDYSQSPEDFMKLAIDDANPEDIAPQKQEAETSPASDKNPQQKGSAVEELSKDDQPQDNAEQPADEKKSGEEKQPDQKTPKEDDPAPKADEPKKQELSPEEHQKREASKIIQRQGEERKRAMMAHAEAVRENPDHINVIAKYDKRLANEVVKEVYGWESVEELVEQTRLAKLREEDPDAAATEERLLRLERKNREDEEKHKVAAENTRKEVEKVFFNNKGITVSEVDPLYSRVMEKLELLNPSFVQNNYSEALAEAARMAGLSQNEVDPAKVEMQTALNKETANPVSNSGGIKQPHKSQSQYSEAQEGFASLVGADLTS